MADRFAWPASSPSESATPTRDFWKFEEPSRFNLWRLGSCSIRRQWVRPTSKLSWGTASSFPITKNLEALIYGRQIRLAGIFPLRVGNADQRFLEIRRTQPLQSRAAGFVFYPAAAGGSGPCPLERLLKKITCKIKVGVIY